ncbi:MAG TPA: SMI1/KNR4 family protein [Clostridia bacterium]
MIQTALNEQISRIKEKLPIAKAKDLNLNVFGSQKHKYALANTVSSQEVEAFEQNNNIVLPIEYKLFLYELGNGGAGPYYGIYPLKTSSVDQYLSKPCKLHPKMSDDEWNSLISFQNDDNIDDDQYEKARSELFQGMLEIGTQGCTYNMMMVVSGDYKGRVVYIDEDLQKPFVTFESNFLDWYERWLDEIIKGYDMFWFGMKMGGDDTELTRVFMGSEDEVCRIDSINGMYKLPALSSETIKFLQELCCNASNKIKITALGLITKHCFSKAKPFLMQLLESNEEDQRLIALKYIHWYADKNVIEMIDTVKGLLTTTTNPENFKFITYILEKGNFNDISVYIPFFYNADKEIRKSAIYTVGKSSEKGKYLTDFINCLHDEEPWVVHTTVQALNGLTDTSLIPHFEELLEKYKTNEFYIRSNVKLCLEKYGKTAGNTCKSEEQRKTRNGLVSKIISFLGIGK